MLKFWKSEKGGATLLVSLAFTGLLAVTGLVVDGGLLYSTHSHLQKAANAAALSGGQELTSDDEMVVEGIVEETLLYHDELTTLQDVIVVKDERVTVKLKKTTELTFMKLFGIDSIDVNVKATARTGVMGSAVGAAPLGIDESIELIYGEEYTLKVDEDGVDTGNFGVLGLAGSGAKTYEQTLLEGFDQELKVGDVVETETGNIAGKTKSATDILINSCDNMYERDCPRVLLVPVYKPHNHDQNQMKEVEITGFAYFYLSEPMDGQEKEIKGQFIKRTGQGHELDEAVERGAFIVRLTD